jgi:NADH:ubiquinone oxidoreductase subunit F (NADH-binding)
VAPRSPCTASSRPWRRQAGGHAVAVGNAAEGDPASHKDKTLLRLAPHLVLDRLQLAAEAGDATRALFYVRTGLRAGTRLDTRVSERNARGLDRGAVELVSAPNRLLTGQESALVSLVSGGAAVPTFTPPRIFERGVDGRPTLVQNVETLAHLALIARYGQALLCSAKRSSAPREPVPGVVRRRCSRYVLAATKKYGCAQNRPHSAGVSFWTYPC